MTIHQYTSIIPPSDSIENKDKNKMNQYDHYDQLLVDQRVAEFRQQTQDYLKGELTEDQYRPLRLMNGLYIQRYAPMLRVAIPYGLLSSKQLRKLAHIARTYDKGFGHFSTRQNIQYNWPKLESVPDILAELAEVEMHAIQTSGNCIRNVTADHLAGVNSEEIEDPRPYCELIRQWSSFHPEFTFLPRKFKIAVSGSIEDRAAAKVHDIGLYLHKNSQGETGFEVHVGGGLGRTPVIGKCIKSFLAKADLLSYLEAILRVYNRFGRRDNKYKARIKILVNALGIDKFRELVEQTWQQIKNNPDLQLKTEDIARITNFFQPPAYQTNPLEHEEIKAMQTDHNFAHWYQHNTGRHKIPGYNLVYISLKAPDVPPGDATDEQMDVIADLADQYSFGEIRVIHNQNLLLGDVKTTDLYAIWQTLKEHQLATANIGTLTDMICCPGLDLCSLANAETLSIAKQINDRFTDLDYLYDLGEIKVKISGCMNACGHHHVGHIGILGVEKKGEQWYQIAIGGTEEREARLATILGASVPQNQVASTIAKLLEVFVSQREEDERFLDTVERIGIKPFKQHVYS